MSDNLVSYTLNLSDSPTFTQDEEEQLEVLSRMSEEDIDCSDAPSLSSEAWDQAVRGRSLHADLYAEPVQVDPDVLAWFRQQDKDYQFRINEILRKEMHRAMLAAAEEHSEPLKKSA